LSPCLRQGRSTAVLAQLDLFLQFVVPPGAPAVFLDLVRSRRGNGRQFVQSDGRVEQDEKVVECHPALVPSDPGVGDGFGVHLHGKISPISRRGLGYGVGGPFEAELGVSHLFGNVGGETQQQDPHGVDVVALNLGRLSLPTVVVDSKELADLSPLVDVGHHVLEVENVIVGGDLERDPVLQVRPNGLAGQVREVPVGTLGNARARARARGVGHWRSPQAGRCGHSNGGGGGADESSSRQRPRFFGIVVVVVAVVNVTGVAIGLLQNGAG